MIKRKRVPATRIPPMMMKISFRYGYLFTPWHEARRMYPVVASCDNSENSPFIFAASALPPACGTL